MTIRSVSFDDDSDVDLCVLSGDDMLASHYDRADPDWREIAERSSIDERRGLVIAQVAVLEDLVDEFLLYLEDPADQEKVQHDLDRLTLGPRLDRLERALTAARLLDTDAVERLAGLRAVATRRNQLAHGTTYWRPLQVVPIRELGRRTIQLEWILVDRRTRESERVSMAGLREDLQIAIGTFEEMLAFGERIVERAPRPAHFEGGVFLGPWTA